MALSRRKFLQHVGGSVALGCALRSVADESQSATSPVTRYAVLIPNAAVPRECRVTHQMLDEREPCIEACTKILLLRPADLLHLYVEWDGLRLIEHRRRLVLEQADTSFEKHLAFHFPPQHLAEMPYCDLVEINEDDPNVLKRYPAQAEWANASRLVFKLDPNCPNVCLPFDLRSLLSWDTLPLLPSVVPVALPQLDTADAVVKNWAPQPGELVMAAPLPYHTAIEAPYHLILSPDEYSRWRHSINPDLCARGRSGTRTVLWHTRLMPSQYPSDLKLKGRPDINGGQALAIRPDLQNRPTVRAVWSQEYLSCQQPDPECKDGKFVEPKADCGKSGCSDLYLPSPRDRYCIVRESSDFHMKSIDCGDGTCGADCASPCKFVPDAIPVNKFLLSSGGASLNLHAEFNVKNILAVVDVDEWIEVFSGARDDEVLVSHAGYLMPFGHAASYIVVAQRRFRTLRNGTRVLAPLIKRCYCRVRQPHLTYLDLLDDSYTAQFPNHAASIGRSNPFRDVIITPECTPNLQCPCGCPKPDSKEPAPGEDPCETDPCDRIDYSWMELDGTNRPFEFTVTCIDWQGQQVTGTMPLLWVNRGFAQSRLTPPGPMLDRYNAASLSRRALNLNRQKVGMVRQSEVADQNKSPDKTDTSFETHSIEWKVEPTAGNDPTRDKPVRVGETKCLTLTFTPLAERLRIQLDAVRAFAPSSPDSAVPVKYDAAYLKNGFAKDLNPTEVYAEIENAKALDTTLKFDAKKSGGLATPSFDITHISRSLGPTHSQPSGSRPVGLAPLNAQPQFQFDAGSFFEGLDFAVNLLGAVELTEVIAPIAEVAKELTRVPQLIAEQLGGLYQAYQDVMAFKAQIEEIAKLVEGGPETIAKEALRAVRETAEAQLRLAAEELLKTALLSADEFRKANEQKIIDEYNTALQTALDIYQHTEDAKTALELARKDAETAVNGYVDAHVGLLRKKIFDAETTFEIAVATGQKKLMSYAKLKEEYVLKMIAMNAQAIVFQQSDIDRVRSGFDQFLNDYGTTIDQGIRRVKRYMDAYNAISLGDLQQIKSDVQALTSGFDVRNIPASVAGIRSKLNTLQKHLSKIANSSDLAREQQAIISDYMNRATREARDFTLQQQAALTNQYQQLETAVNGAVAAGAAQFLQLKQELNDTRDALQAQVEKEIQDGILKPINDGLNAVLTDPAAWAAFNQGAAKLQTALNDALKLVNDMLGLVDEVKRKIDEFVPKELNLHYEWEPVLHDGGAFQACYGPQPATLKITANIRKTLDLSNISSPPSVNVHGSLRNFQINLLPSSRYITVAFHEVSFDSVNGSTPDITVKMGAIRFGEALSFVAELAKKLSPDNGFFIELFDLGVLAGFRWTLPTISTGAMNLIDLSFNAGVALSFGEEPATLNLSVSTRQRPFTLSVGIYGGGGFFGLKMTPKGVVEIEGALEFGAIVALDLMGIARGKAYVMAGIYFCFGSNHTVLSGYVRAGGSLNILGLITVTVEFYLALGYEQRGNDSYAVGECSLTIEIDIFFFSIEVRLTMRKEFAGSQSSSTPGRSVSAMSAPQLQGAGVGGLSAPGALQPELESFSTKPEVDRSHFSDCEWRRYRSNFAW